MSIKIDLTQSRTIPDCTVPLLITDCDRKDPEDWNSTEDAPGPSGKYPYLNWTLTISEGEHTDTDIRHMTTLSPKALFGLKALTVAAGGEWPDEDSQDEFDFDPKDLFGSSVLGDIYTDNYGGNKSNKVKKFYPIEDKDEVALKNERGGGRRRSSREE